ncbi:transmembrane and ubiquitin-like domain-containing protein 1 [Homalodisca vitripennis]|uniref:transmembrane and ubiquitin-like domain-containing protein 1 n=1 Tax=Homalodisca vitripennis TaxID=197043 RepID=UPI001EEB1BDC|nr:transmembrane and ubiquitin-like domain-containing protein 1 [Homalodisca vitripennis]
MPVIEGIGDEVIQCFSVVLLVLAVVILWSTKRRENQNLILTLEHTVRNRIDEAITAATSLPEIITNQDASNGMENVFMNHDWLENESESAFARDGVITCSNIEGSELLPVERSLTTDTQPGPSSKEQIPRKKKDQFLIVQSRTPSMPEITRNMPELARGKRVRLIFNGRILDRDHETLQEYGLYENCVVHCLVDNNCTLITPNTASSYHQSLDLSLSSILYSLLFLLLTLLWFCRFQYSHLFTLFATVSLIDLTALFAVYMFLLYLPSRN